MQPRIVVRQEPGYLVGFGSRELGQHPLQIGERINLDQATRSHDRVQHRRSPAGLRVPYVHPVLGADFRGAYVALDGVLVQIYVTKARSGIPNEARPAIQGKRKNNRMVARQRN